MARGAPVAAVCLALLASAATAADAQSNEVELAIKAAYLSKLPNYVGWPELGRRFHVCVAGRDPFGPVLEHAMRGATVERRPVQVRRLSSADGLELCQLVYVADGDPSWLRRAAAPQPVLTVTDARTDPPTRGVVHFVVRGNRVRFFIDKSEADRRGLRISARLFDIALRPPEEGE